MKMAETGLEGGVQGENNPPGFQIDKNDPQILALAVKRLAETVEARQLEAKRLVVDIARHAAIKAGTNQDGDATGTQAGVMAARSETSVESVTEASATRVPA